MANHSERPTVDLAAGRAVLEADLPRVLAVHDAQQPEELGWRQIDKRTLLVPIFGEHEGGVDEYLLRLRFLTGREWPPSALFVNPQTLDYTIPADFEFLPIVRTDELKVHTKYRNRVEDKEQQLICCSATFEYYDVLHGGQDEILWQDTDDFNHTLNAIRRAMGRGYLGRQAAHVE